MSTKGSPWHRVDALSLFLPNKRQGFVIARQASCGFIHGWGLHYPHENPSDVPYGEDGSTRRSRSDQPSTESQCATFQVHSDLSSSSPCQNCRQTKNFQRALKTVGWHSSHRPFGNDHARATANHVPSGRGPPNQGSRALRRSRVKASAHPWSHYRATKQEDDASKLFCESSSSSCRPRTQKGGGGGQRGSRRAPSVVRRPRVSGWSERTPVSSAASIASPPSTG